MIVVSDTGPINYLALIDVADILPALFGAILIPEAVYRELNDRRTPDCVREWLRVNAHAFEVRRPAGPLVTGTLDPGERQAISLAIACNADALLVDDFEAREVAGQNGVRVIGTIGVLEAAAAKRLVSLSDAFERLRRTNFRISEHLLQDVLNRQR